MQAPLFHQLRESRVPESAVKRWIDKYDIPRGLSEFQLVGGGPTNHVSSVPRIQCQQMLLDRAERHGVAINEVTVRGAAGQCLDAQRTGTGELSSSSIS